MNFGYVNFDISLSENTSSLLESLKKTLIEAHYSTNCQLDCYAYFLDDDTSRTTSKHHITTDGHVHQAIKHVREKSMQKTIGLHFVKTQQFVPVI
jgi:signal transduction protein with GAF and PtsI domain